MKKKERVTIKREEISMEEAGEIMKRSNLPPAHPNIMKLIGAILRGEKPWSDLSLDLPPPQPRLAAWDVGHYQILFKHAPAFGGCGLEFLVLTNFPGRWDRRPAYCPECGGQGGMFPSRMMASHLPICFAFNAPDVRFDETQDGEQEVTWPSEEMVPLLVEAK